jgi:phage tail-like protein
VPQFTVNADRFDPYKNFKFRVKFQGRTDAVAGVSKISPLKRTTEVVEHREGGDLSTERKSPGRTKFEAITMERGVTYDPDFEQWANLVYSTEGDAAVSLAGYKRNLIIEVLNLQGVTVKTYRVFRAWVSEYTALPELDANANAVMIESIVIQNEGFERDTDVVEQAET